MNDTTFCFDIMRRKATSINKCQLHVSISLLQITEKTVHTGRSVTEVEAGRGVFFQVIFKIFLRKSVDPGPFSSESLVEHPPPGSCASYGTPCISWPSCHATKFYF